MEGPSLFLAAQQLAPFIKKTIQQVGGNTHFGKERLFHKEILDIFSWGKHLVFQFDEFALRVHFMLFGSFEATVQHKKITGDYPRKNRVPRLQLVFPQDQIDFYSCSLQYLESSHAKDLYDYTIDIMSPHWDATRALEKLLSSPDEEIGDLLLDQKIFAGVGNIIKNEVLYLVKKAPDQKAGNLSLAKKKQIILTVQRFALQFYRWRKRFVLRKHYQIYRKSICPRCLGRVSRKKTGSCLRISFFCPNCQK
jgi:endonuclease-8